MEKEELKKCLEYLEVVGIHHWRNNTGAVAYNAPCSTCKRRPKPGGTRFVRYGIKGHPDIMGFIPGGVKSAIPFFWEVKSPTGAIRKAQVEFIQDAQENGCIAGIGTFEQMVGVLNSYGIRQS